MYEMNPKLDDDKGIRCRVEKKPTADVFAEPLLQSFYVVGIQVLENNHEMGTKRAMRGEKTWSDKVTSMSTSFN